jgi:hypothetical protein
MFKEEAVSRLPRSEEGFAAGTAAYTKNRIAGRAKTSLVTARRSVNNLGWSGP